MKCETIPEGERPFAGNHDVKSVLRRKARDVGSIQRVIPPVRKIENGEIPAGPENPCDTGKMVVDESLSGLIQIRESVHRDRNIEHTVPKITQVPAIPFV